MSTGYSGKPLTVKLGVAEGSAVAIVDDPGNALDLLAPLPAGAQAVASTAEADLVLWFVTDLATLEHCIAQLGDAIFPARMLWVAWPKRASGVATDLSEDLIRSVALPPGLVDVQVCAIDETWSGLKLGWRKELRGSR
jgi:hypothetical protein